MYCTIVILPIEKGIAVCPVGNSGSAVYFWISGSCDGGMSEWVRIAGEAVGKGRLVAILAVIVLAEYCDFDWGTSWCATRHGTLFLMGHTCSMTMSYCECWSIIGWNSHLHRMLILTKWFLSTRLETRTKESNIYASIWVENPIMRNESKGSLLLW